MPNPPEDDDPAAPLPCICLAGPTASGKTAGALAIARALSPRRPVEIVSVDSALVYRGMDIGTAKPSRGELAQAPHHLIDIIDPAEAYSAARFVADARRLVGEIRARGHWPLLVGGTMLYFKALFDGLDEMPPADPAVRAALAAQLDAQGLPALHDELRRVDPVSAQRLAPGDTQRILRALEVFRVGGVPLSALQRRDREGAARPQPLLISLEPRDRAWLHGRIEQRFRQMLDDGLVAEVQGLIARGDLRADLPSMRCVGYRQAWEALESGDLSQLAERGIAATRQLAKRQATWLRGMPGRQVVDCDAVDAVQRVVALAQAGVDALASRPPPPAVRRC